MLAQLSDAELAAARDGEMEKLSSRARTAALALYAGKSARAAAREAGLSTHPSAVSRLQDRIAPALGLLREEARRASKETAETAARWFDELAHEARRAKDFGAAARAKREAGLLRGLYPDPRIRVEHELIDLREVTPEEIEALARIRHVVRPRLAARVIEAEVTPIDPPLSPSDAQPSETSARALSEEGIPPSEEAPDAA